MEAADQPRQFHSIPKSNDIEKHAGLCVAVDAIDGCHGGPNTLLRGADDHWDDIVLLRHSSCRNLCFGARLVICIMTFNYFSQLFSYSRYFREHSGQDEALHSQSLALGKHVA